MVNDGGRKGKLDVWTKVCFDCCPQSFRCFLYRPCGHYIDQRVYAIWSITVGTLTHVFRFDLWLRLYIWFARIQIVCMILIIYICWIVWIPENQATTISAQRLNSNVLMTDNYALVGCGHNINYAQCMSVMLKLWVDGNYHEPSHRKVRKYALCLW